MTQPAAAGPAPGAGSGGGGKQAGQRSPCERADEDVATPSRGCGPDHHGSLCGRPVHAGGTLRPRWPDFRHIRPPNAFEMIMSWS